MRNAERRRQRPRVEMLESLAPLSGAAGAMTAAVGVRNVPSIVHLPFATPIVLQGTVRGGYYSSQGNPDTGTTFRIGAAGRITPLGLTSETARIQTTGFILSGKATGTMTISAPRGTLTLNLTGPAKPGFSSLPGTFTFTVTGGTRAYRNVVGNGTIGVTLNASVVSSRFGLITLNFHGIPTPVA